MVVVDVGVGMGAAVGQVGVVESKGKYASLWGVLGLGSGMVG